MVSAYCLGCGGIDTVPRNTNTQKSIGKEDKGRKVKRSKYVLWPDFLSSELLLKMHFRCYTSEIVIFLGQMRRYFLLTTAAILS